MNFIKHITSFELSKELFEYGVDPILDIGSFGYHKLTEELFIILNTNEKTSKTFSFETGKNEEIKNSIIYKAYLASELGELLPSEYNLPIKVEDGWAYISGENEIVLVENDDYYETETQARMKYLLYFLKLKMIKPEDLNP